MKYSKIPKWDRHRPEFLQIGFVLALSFVLMAFNYTTDRQIDDHYSTGPIIDDTPLEVFPPRTDHPTRVLPPPPEPKIDLVAEVVDADPEFVDELPEEIFSDEPAHDQPDMTDYVAPPTPYDAPIVAPVTEPITPEEGPVPMADRMPTYASCDIDANETERRLCTSDQIMTFIYDHVSYPSFARQNRIEGTVVVSFVVDQSGEVQNVEIMRDIGGGCGAEVTRVIDKLGKFYPGKQNGRPVSVIYRLPVKFKLQ